MIRLWEAVLEHDLEAAFGFRRFLSQSSFTYRYVKGNQFISQFYGILFNEVATDIMCGLKLIPSEILAQMDFRLKKFAVEIEIPLELLKHKLRPYEIEVYYKPRTREEGKVIGIRDAIYIIYAMILIRIKWIFKK